MPGRQIVIAVLVLSGALISHATAENTLLLGNGHPPDQKHLDPHRVNGVGESNVARALFEGLVIKDPINDGAVLPGAAERWETDLSAKRWAFHLRKDAMWSDGKPVTASDFVFSFKRALTPETACDFAFMLFEIKGAAAFHRERIDDFSKVGVKAPDPHTLVIELGRPVPYLLHLATSFTWLPVPKDLGFDDPLENFVSNGPFVFESWGDEEEASILVKKNPRYWDAKTVSLDKIKFVHVKRWSEEEKQFHQGKLHVTYKLSEKPLKKSAPFTRHDLYFGTQFVRCNLERKPLADRRVRRALSFALDQQAIIDATLTSGHRPATGLVPPYGQYSGVKKVAFDPERAKKLMETAGFPGGKGFPELKITTPDSRVAVNMASSIVARWKKHLGIEVTVRPLPWIEYINGMMAGDYDLTTGGWIGDYLDPVTFLDMWVENGSNNRTGWSSKAFEDKIKAANLMYDKPKRYRQLMMEAETILLEERPILPIYWYPRSYLISPAVKGWSPTLLDDRSYKFVRLEE